MSGLPSLHRAVLETKAHAKVNLALSVGGAREEDGMHPIASWMARIDLADELQVTRLEEGYLSRYAILWHKDALRRSAIDWSITKDLAVRAHLLLEEELGRSLPVQLKLEKRIPVGGGLGGGSADAAAMLLAVCELFDLDGAPERLVELAATLGSDVAYFLEPGAAYVGGLGDQIERTAPVRGDMVLVMPEFGCPTGAVYRAFDRKGSKGLRTDDVLGMARAGTVDATRLFNDLEDAAIEIAPDLEGVFETVERICAGRRVHLSGSGSTLFVLCDGTREGKKLAKEIERSIDGVRACAVGFV
jgi:4-diphosphocytidyl-2-C-methyl-D-erythritol kinase